MIRLVTRLIDYGKGGADPEFSDMTLGMIADRIIRLSLGDRCAELGQCALTLQSREDPDFVMPDYVGDHTTDLTIPSFERVVDIGDE